MVFALHFRSDTFVDLYGTLYSPPIYGPYHDCLITSGPPYIFTLPILFPSDRVLCVAKAFFVLLPFPEMGKMS
jgi:hypothetical protein